MTAGNSDGVWSEHAAALRLRVLPRVWERWWFLALVVLAALSAVALVVRSLATRRLRHQLERAERQRAVERDRARIAKDIHDDLGGGLTQIALLSELAIEEPQREAEAHLMQISDTARDLTRAMDEIVWAVNPRHDTLDSLTTYLCRFAQEYLLAADIQCRLDVPAELPPLPVSSEIRHNLYLAFKEALNNVIKHSGARTVQLRLRGDGGCYTWEIADDGQGFDPAAGRALAPSGGRLVSGQSLGNLELRLAAIGGRCVIDSAEPNESGGRCSAMGRRRQLDAKNGRRRRRIVSERSASAVAASGGHDRLRASASGPPTRARPDRPRIRTDPGHAAASDGHGC